MKLRPSHMAPPWDLTKRFMELRPSHPTPPWNLTKSFMELRQSHTITMSHLPNIDLWCITISCQYLTNHPIMIHEFIHTNLINSNPNISYRTYKVSYLNCLKQQIIQSCETYTYPINFVNIVQAKELSLKREEPLAQATNSRLGETTNRGHVESCSSESTLAQASGLRLGDPSK